ncbi:type I-E CRISPR-associated protein Cse1/CasA [Bifidobacterium rousetti]|uniref:type I-E CRISPR-associated protein Cse1/CasA n=1 Tax=Bifidobacterium rousetti TaxID=2045439 RepID=UPI00123BAF3B|nr:type I-E CRISPR-associated protein Cse1/CasA [Bifidobacterium rousetti]KAA8816149.1 type I-E CRISPR-associated protein Cse1/CasA [Bifidobacterium rousetti]
MSTDNTSFDLTERPWMPVILKDGTKTELSLKKAFAFSRDIVGFDDRIGVTPFALTRLMEAVLYGVYGHSFDVVEWDHLLQNGPDLLRINDYLDARRRRFDLFDPVTPFYQCAGLQGNGEQQTFELTRLTVTNEARPVRHTDGTLGFAEAARWLVVAQAYNISGIKTGVKGGGGTKPIGVGWAGGIGGLVVEGPNLWSTLILNFIPELVLDQNDAGATWADDRPVWDREQPGSAPTAGYTMTKNDEGDPTSLRGPATLYTWQSRRILLHHDGQTVTGCVVANGDRTRADNAMAYEPMTAWVRNDKREKALKLPMVFIPARHAKERALWRGLSAIITAKRDQGRGPYTLRWLAKTGFIGAVRLHAYGMAYGTRDSIYDTCISDSVDAPIANLTATDPLWADMATDAIAKADEGVSAVANLVSDICHAAGVEAEKPDRKGPRYKARADAYAELGPAFLAWFGQTHADPESAYQSWLATAKQVIARVADRIEADAPLHAVIGREVEEGKGAKKKTVYMTAALAGMRCRGNLDKIFGKDTE